MLRLRAIKRLLRETALYRYVDKERTIWSLKRWTEADQRRLEFYREFVRPGDLCFDVGANLGNRTKVFLKIGAWVVAVEPQTCCASTLRRLYGRNPRLVVVEKAIGASEGRAEMLVSSAHTLSSLSLTWVARVRASGRFAGHEWTRRQAVEVTTLDRLIEAHGMPSFIKIDVEGFEREVLAGLSQPVKALSLEVATESLDSVMECLRLLSSLGPLRLNSSTGESMVLDFAEWKTLAEMATILTQRALSPLYFGDVYVRFVDADRA